MADRLQSGPTTQRNRKPNAGSVRQNPYHQPRLTGIRCLNHRLRSLRGLRHPMDHAVKLAVSSLKRGAIANGETGARRLQSRDTASQIRRSSLRSASVLRSAAKPPFTFERREHFGEVTRFGWRNGRHDIADLRNYDDETFLSQTIDRIADRLPAHSKLLHGMLHAEPVTRLERAVEDQGLEMLVRKVHERLAAASGRLQRKACNPVCASVSFAGNALSLLP